MDVAALAVEVFGVCSLSVALAKYTYARHKTINAEDNMKNHRSTKYLTKGHNFPI